MVARVAIYYAPLPQDPLTPLSSSWLGRDPVTNAPVPQPSLDGISEFTAEPRLYGFHATLKPPMSNSVLLPGTDTPKRQTMPLGAQRAKASTMAAGAAVHSMTMSN